MNKNIFKNETPIRKIPFLGWPFFAKDEIAAVKRVLQSGKVNYWTGNEDRLLEKEFATSISVTDSRGENRQYNFRKNSLQYESHSFNLQ